MPCIAVHGGKPLHERTPLEILWMFGVLPILFGGGLLVLAVVQIAWSSGRMIWQDWLGAVWSLVMAAVLMIGLPNIGWRELQRRKQRKDASSQAQDADRRNDPGIKDAGH